MVSKTDNSPYKPATRPADWKVLLVDDDEDDYVLTRKMLQDSRSRPIQLVWASSYAESLRQLEADTFDAVLVDYNLGTHSGLDVVREALARGVKSPFLLYTGVGNYDVDMEAMQAGVADYLTKEEVDGPLLERAIRYAIENKQHQEALEATNQQLQAAYQAVEQLVEERTWELSRANRELRNEIEERKRIQAALQDREARLSVLLEQLPLIAYTTDRDLRITSMQGKASPERPEENFTMVGRVIAESRIFPHGHPVIGAHHKALAGEPVAVEFEAMGNWFQSYIEPYRDRDGQIVGCLGVAIDITEQKRAREALRASSETLEKIFASIHMSVALLGRDLRFIRVNQKFAEAQGKQPQDFAGQCPFEIYPSPAIEAIFRQVVDTGESFVTYAQPFIFPEDPQRGPTYWDWSLSPILDPHGRVESLVLTLLDVTGRLKDQKQIIYQSYLLENVTDAVIAADERLRITAWNSAAEQIYGWKSEEALGKSVLELIPAQDMDPDESVATQFLDRQGGYQGELFIQARDGSLVNIEAKAVVLRDDNGRMAGFVAVHRDITERKRIEQELVEIRRMLVQNEDTRRIALAQEIHDGPVQALYAMLYRMVEVQSTAHNQKEEVELAILREELRMVIESLRSISVELRPPALVPYGLEKAIRSHCESIHKRYPHLGINLELEPDGQLLPANTRLTMYRIFQEALMNAVRHSRASTVEVRLALHPDTVELQVQDNGIGFQVPERMVDFAREGHLGLVGAFERAEAARISLELDSHPGQGTRVRVTASRAGMD